MATAEEGQGKRRAVKLLLLTLPGALEKGGDAIAEILLEKLRSQKIISTKKSINSIRHDFLSTLRALDELGVLTDRTAYRLPSTRSAERQGWLHRYNQFLFQNPDWSDKKLKLALEGEGFSGFNLAGSHGATSESIALLRAYGALVSNAVNRLEDDLQEIEERKGIKDTVRKRLIDARLGQGQFRADLLRRWENACAVTGSTVLRAIRASHAKPWRASTDEEKLCPENGLPLLGTLDALFDAGLIAFDENGRMRLSPELKLLQPNELEQLGVDGEQRLRRSLTEKEKSFLAYHRNCIFRLRFSVF